MSKVPRNSFPHRSGGQGFSLIELLVVMFIILMIGTIVLAYADFLAPRARVTRATADLLEFRKAIQTMSIDTRTWPNGCAIGHAINRNENRSDNIVNVSGVDPNSEQGTSSFLPPTDQSGLTANAPLQQTLQSTGCGWTTGAVSRWKGPYIKTAGLIDPWGHPYWFDNAYLKHYNCCTGPNCPNSSNDPLWHATCDQGLTAAVFSLGPDGNNATPTPSNLKAYDCDDIYLELPNDYGNIIKTGC